jgi:surface-anchored protein
MRKSVFAIVLAAGGSVALAGGGPLSPGHTVISGSVLPPPSPNPVLVTDDVDIGFGIKSGDSGPEIEPHIHDEATDTEFEPFEALFFVAPEALVTRPVGSVFDFIGVGAGQQFSLLPSDLNADLPYVGWGTEEIAAGTLVGGVLNVRLNGVAGGADGSLPAPGFVSVFTLGLGGPSVRWASFDGIDASDVIVLNEDSHTHFNIAFSAPGLYAVTLEADAALVEGGRINSEEVTYYFNVVVPEPSALALLAPAALLLGRRRK